MLESRAQLVSITVSRDRHDRDGGAEDVRIVVCDDLKELPKPITTTCEHATVQTHASLQSAV